jgi:hypothetical protein
MLPMTNIHGHFFMLIQNRKKGIGDERKKQNRVNDLAKENRYLE